jgi:hypothetical protein
MKKQFIVSLFCINIFYSVLISFVFGFNFQWLMSSIEDAILLRFVIVIILIFINLSIFYYKEKIENLFNKE